MFHYEETEGFLLPGSGDSSPSTLSKGDLPPVTSKKSLPLSLTVAAPLKPAASHSQSQSQSHSPGGTDAGTVTATLESKNDTGGIKKSILRSSRMEREGDSLRSLRDDEEGSTSTSISSAPNSGYGAPVKDKETPISVKPTRKNSFDLYNESKNKASKDVTKVDLDSVLGKAVSNVGKDETVIVKKGRVSVVLSKGIMDNLNIDRRSLSEGDGDKYGKGRRSTLTQILGFGDAPFWGTRSTDNGKEAKPRLSAIESKKFDGDLVLDAAVTVDGDDSEDEDGSSAVSVREKASLTPSRTRAQTDIGTNAGRPQDEKSLMKKFSLQSVLSDTTHRKSYSKTLDRVHASMGNVLQSFEGFEDGGKKSTIDTNRVGGLSRVGSQGKLVGNVSSLNHQRRTSIKKIVGGGGSDAAALRTSKFHREKTNLHSLDDIERQIEHNRAMVENVEKEEKQLSEKREKLKNKLNQTVIDQLHKTGEEKEMEVNQLKSVERIRDKLVAADFHDTLEREANRFIRPFKALIGYGRRGKAPVMPVNSDSTPRYIHMNSYSSLHTLSLFLIYECYYDIAHQLWGKLNALLLCDRRASIASFYYFLKAHFVYTGIFSYFRC
jgi:hypothetical protein